MPGTQFASCFQGLTFNPPVKLGTCVTPMRAWGSSHLGFCGVGGWAWGGSSRHPGPQELRMAGARPHPHLGLAPARGHSHGHGRLGPSVSIVSCVHRGSLGGHCCCHCHSTDEETEARGG